MNQLEVMQIYLKVAELASFTEAALQLGLPKASVSQAVQRLEALLGTRLLQRTTRRVSMTADGQVFAERCRDLLADVEELRTLFQGDGHASGLTGRLRVDMPQTTAREFILPRLPEFLSTHPGLSVELSSTDRRVDVVREGFDCVLRAGPLSDSSLVARPLGQHEMVNCVSAGYAANHGVPASLQDLSGHRLVHYASTLGTRPQGFEHVDLKSGETLFVPMPGSLTVNNADAYEAACLAGLGIIQFPAVSAQPHIRAGRMVEVLPEHRAAPLALNLVYAHRRHLPRRVQAFMDWVAAVMAEHLQPMH
jgi:DNA-binding transcriptional LysR family regulator